MAKTPRVHWRAQAPPPPAFRGGRSMSSPISGSPPSSPRNNSSSPDYIGRLGARRVRTQDVPMEYPISPRRSPRLNNPAGGHRTSSPFKGYKARFAIDEEDIEMGGAEPAKGSRKEPTSPPASPLRRSPRRQRLESAYGPVEPPSRGRTLRRESWPFTSVAVKPEPAEDKSVDEYQKLEALARSYNLRSRQKRISGGMTQAQIRSALEKERKRRRSISPDKLKSALKKREERKAASNLTNSSSVSTEEELIRDVERQLTCPLRDCSPLTDLGDEIRVSWPEDERLVTQKTIDNDFIGWSEDDSRLPRFPTPESDTCVL